MSLEIAEQLIPLRAMAHPLRLRILSLTTAMAMSASEIADELGIKHAAASYHARQLAEAGLLQAIEDPTARTGPGRPPVRYRYLAQLSERLDRFHGGEALWAATAQDIERRLGSRTRPRVGADAEVWMLGRDFETIATLAQQISDLIHEHAQPPHSAGTIHGSVTVFVFELEDSR